MTQPASTPEPVSPRHVTVTAVHWRNVLEFTQLFRGFRLAMNPAKIFLALLALLLIYSAGRLFDLAWGPQVYSDEIVSYQTELPKNYNRLRDQRISGRATNLYMLLRQIDDPALPLEDVERLKNSPRAAYRTLKSYYERQFQTNLKNLAQQRELQEKELSGNSFVTRDSQTPAQVEQEERAREARRLKSRIDAVKVAAGAGIFASFMDFELQQFDALVENTLSFVRILPARPPRLDISIPGQAVSAGIVSREPDSIWRSDTIAGSLANMTVTGPTWLVSATAPMQWRPVAEGDAAGKPLTWGGWCRMVAYRGVYVLSLLVLVLFAIVVLALTGATISRLSALELAGIERASITEVFLFSYRRLWVFIKAPITPFLIILVVGLFLTAVSLLGAIPYVGEIILGVLFIALLLVGFVLMLLVLGVLGGLNLLFPTIAVEGSDAFDAMSRAFAYVYARPWRLIFYTLISLIYGVITYLFVSFAVYLVLLITHTFSGWGAGFFGRAYGHFSGVPKLDTLWPTPQFGRLIGPTNWYAMNWSEYTGSLFLHFWVYLFITAIGAFVVSYYFSSHTIIYLLLRRSVDGQATTEVFLEEPPPLPPSALTPTSTTTA